MKWSEVPIPVLISGGIIVFFLIVFLGSFPFLTGARDEAQNQNNRLQNDLQSTNASIDRARNDYAFVEDNERRFEEAMASDEIMPHTRRAAARQIQTVAIENGLMSLNYNFALAASPDQGRGQGGPSASDAYRLQVENLSLEIGAALDRSVYAFIEELVRTIPGTIVIREFQVGRAESISTEMLNRVAQGQNSGIITGTVRFSWRTAQANREAEQ